MAEWCKVARSLTQLVMRTSPMRGEGSIADHRRDGLAIALPFTFIEPSEQLLDGTALVFVLAGWRRSRIGRRCFHVTAVARYDVPDGSAGVTWNQDRLIDWIIDEFRKDKGIDLSKDNMAMQRVREAAQKAEIDLRTATSTTIDLPFITADASGPKHLSLTVAQTKFHQIIAQLGRS